ncbi:unnamed protein product [Chondrus crispus]|uniref:Uncharacterized protein n=1 Tax=Chondrus crispus TaxID=2769 RepID=R7QNF6_CHOCR|nr:unnamed protein product [Chondrus crispus]CDF38986.1 unnamed protein product [Chondrus crispus]|eukprot:XP_005718891.1 unnamed protein product [Chondrus crispus]
MCIPDRTHPPHRHTEPGLHVETSYSCWTHVPVGCGKRKDITHSNEYSQPEIVANAGMRRLLPDKG